MVTHYCSRPVIQQNSLVRSDVTLLRENEIESVLHRGLIGEVMIDHSRSSTRNVVENGRNTVVYINLTRSIWT